MGFIDSDVLNYLKNTQPLLDGELGKIQRYALSKNIPIIPPEVARLICTLLALKKPSKILEIGCAIGFSAGLMSRYLEDDGHIITIDRFDVMISQAKKNFKLLGIEDRITLLEGDAGAIISNMNNEFDVIFLDAAKGQYLNMLPDCIRLLKTGGLFIADDVLQDGRIAKDRYAIPRRQRTTQLRMHGFLYAVSNTPGLESSILPVGDGVLLAYKTQEFKEICYAKN